MRKAFAPILIIAILGTLGIFQREVLGDIWARLIGLPRISLVPPFHQVLTQSITGSEDPML